MVSMATTNNNQPQTVFFKITSSLLKLANYSAHGDETLCAYVFHCFHDNHQQKMSSGTFPYNYFFTSQTCKPCNGWGWNLVRLCIWVFPWRPSTKNGLRTLLNITTSSPLKLAHHAMHGGETWYACVFQRFHDNHEQKMASGTFPYNYFFTSQTCKPCNAWSWNLVRMCIWAFPWQPLTKNCLRHFFL